MSTIIKHKQFNNFKSWTMDLCGRPLTRSEERRVGKEC